MRSFVDVAEENRCLRRTMRDLVALSTLPAIWRGLGAEGIARSLAEVLLNTLSLDLVFVRLGDGFELVRTPPRFTAPGLEQVRALLEEPIAQAGDSPAALPDFLGCGSLQLAVTRFGVGAEQGVVVAGSLKAEFPGGRDRLLINVGANHAATVLQRIWAESQTLRVEAQLRQAGEQAHAILESITDAFFAVGKGWRITYVNRHAERMLSRSNAQLLGEALWSAFPGLAGTAFERVCRDAMGGAPGSVTSYDPSTSNWYEVRAYPTSGGLALYFRDATEKKLVLERLTEAEAHFRAMADNIPQLSWIADADGEVFWFNQRWYEYTGTTLEEVEGSGWHKVVGPDDLPRAVKSFEKSLKSGEPWEDTFALRRRDGAMRWHLSRAMPIRNAQGVVIRWFGSNTDVTEQREAEHRKNEFIATLAHELRNPLAPIRTGLEVLKRAGHDGEAAERARTMMGRQLDQMVRLIDDLMDVSRITSGKIELRKEQVSLEAVVKSAIETCLPHLEKMRHDLQVVLPQEPITVSADLTRLAQVFMNLLNNAAKYSEPGSKIVLSAAREGDEVVVSVKDDGIGIPAEHLPTVFEMFAQAQRSQERSHGGLGIGLTLVKRLIELHDGTVEARSAGLNLGSEFIVRLPLTTEAMRPASQPQAEVAADGSSLRILIVDDNEDGADSLAMLLQQQGNDIRVAYDGEQALIASEEFRPDVVLLDIGLPKLSGHDVCRRLRAQPGGEQRVVIAQTGWGQPEDRERTLWAGFDHHLVKPLDAKVLDKLLSAHRPGRRLQR